MMKGTVPCKILRVADKHDVYGQPVYESPISTRCEVVRLKASKENTSTRTDGSASGGNAQEIVADAELLFPVRARVKIGDRLEIVGGSYEVIEIHPRFAVTGVHEHDEVKANIWV